MQVCLLLLNPIVEHPYRQFCKGGHRSPRSELYYNSFWLIKSYYLSIQAIIMARTRTNVSLAALRVDPKPLQEDQHDTKQPQPLKRRKSLPTTQEEMTAALRQTASVEAPLFTTKQPTLAELGAPQRQQRPHTSMHYAKQTSPRAAPCSARLGGREKFHISKIDVSEQGIDSLSPKKR